MIARVRFAIAPLLAALLLGALPAATPSAHAERDAHRPRNDASARNGASSRSEQRGRNDQHGRSDQHSRNDSRAGDQLRSRYDERYDNRQNLNNPPYRDPQRSYPQPGYPSAPRSYPQPGYPNPIQPGQFRHDPYARDPGRNPYRSSEPYGYGQQGYNRPSDQRDRDRNNRNNYDVRGSDANGRPLRPVNDVVREVEGTYGGKVVGVQQAGNEYRVRVLQRDGRVKTVSVPAR